MRRAVLDTQPSGLGRDLLDIRHHDRGRNNRFVDTELKSWKSWDALRADTDPLRRGLLFPAVSSDHARRRHPFDLDLDGFYERYLKTCAMWGITPSSRERVDGLVQEWSEVLAGRPEPTQQ